MALWLFLVNWNSDSHQFFFWSALRSWGFPGEVWELKKLKIPGTCVPVNRISMPKLHSKAEESQGCSTTLGTSWGFWETWTQMSGILGAEENSERPRFWWVPGTRVVPEDYSEMAVRWGAPICQETFFDRIGEHLNDSCCWCICLCFLLSFFARGLVLCLHIFMYYNLGQLKWKSAVDKKTGRQPFGLFSKNFDSLYLPLVKEDFECPTTESLPALGEVIPGTTEPWGHWRSLAEQRWSMHGGPRVQWPRPGLGIGG